VAAEHAKPGPGGPKKFDLNGTFLADWHFRFVGHPGRGGPLVSQSGIPPVHALANRRILVAEDEGLIALDLESMLQGFGCEVVGPLSDIHDILSTIRSEPVDGALLDVNLRGRQVFEILPEFISRKIPVVLTSGYDDATLFPRIFRELPRLSKPFDLAALHQVCAATMGADAAA
jgi:CheY-like chemotaxis protein